MHDSSMKLMSKFAEKYDIEGTTVVDIGSFDVNGTYRELFTKAKYIGVDITSGKNVDIIMDSEEWKSLKDVDVVISGQTLEHTADIPKLMDSIYGILKPEGVICMIAPSQGAAHYHPIFVGNFSVDRMREAVSFSGFEIISCKINPVAPAFDCCCIAKKPKEKNNNFGKERSMLTHGMNKVCKEIADVLGLKNCRSLDLHMSVDGMVVVNAECYIEEDGMKQIPAVLKKFKLIEIKDNNGGEKDGESIEKRG